MTFSPLSRSQWHQRTVGLVDETLEFVERIKDLDGFSTDSGFTTKPLREISTQLERPILLFVGGEFNAGKSALINAFAGRKVTPEGVTPTTEELCEIEVDEVICVDSPGLNSIMTFHQERARKALANSDVVLFVTSVERPLSDSELRFLRQARDQWRREIILVVNKTDLRSDDENREIGRFVQEGVHQAVGQEVPLFYVSARTGQGVDDLKGYLLTTYGSAEAADVKCAAALQGLLHFLSERERCLSQIATECRERAQRGEAQLEAITTQLLSSRSLDKMIRHLVEQEFAKARAAALPELTAPKRWNFLAFLKRVLLFPNEFLDHLKVWDQTLEDGLREVDGAVAEHLHQSILSRADDFSGELSIREVRQLLLSPLAVPPSREVGFFAGWFRSFESKRRLYRYICLTGILFSTLASVGLWTTYGEAVGITALCLSLVVCIGMALRGFSSERARIIEHLSVFLASGVDSAHASLSARMSQVIKGYLGRIERALGERLTAAKRLGKDASEALEKAGHLKERAETYLDGIGAGRVARRASETAAAG